VVIRAQNGIMLYCLIADIITTIVCSYISLLARFQTEVSSISRKVHGISINYATLVFLIVGIWILYLSISGLYNFRNFLSLQLTFQILVKRSFSYFFALGFISFITNLAFSRQLFISILASSLLIMCANRILIHKYVLKSMLLKKQAMTHLLIIGNQRNELRKYSDWIIDNELLGFKIACRLECEDISKKWLDEFERILKFTPIDEILLLPGMESDKNFSRFVHYCEDLGIKTNWIPLDSGNLGYWLIPQPQVGIPFLAFSQSKISIAERMLKRSFDLVFSILALVLLSPLYLVISLIILITSGRPVFYSQKRVGLNGKVFNFYKFRSMVKNADQLISSADNVHAKDHVIFKDKKDPRVTPIGRILRKYSLDELPQFFNVLINDMSVVGPRPALVHEVKKYDSMYERRLNAKPGVTGPWQISGRSDLDLQTSVALDLNYMVNWSFTRDLWIIIATIGAVFKGRGAY
jgi:exopolysaccharide biosynthesis polyprenyl glycosylphosphotransferase